MVSLQYSIACVLFAFLTWGAVEHQQVHVDGAHHKYYNHKEGASRADTIKKLSHMYKDHPPDVKRQKSNELKQKLRAYEKNIRSDRRHKRKRRNEL
mmetsp:Transcript_11962/g.19472  ORF Transcript_11962/g.19472 Transcript_11962/m.19472 type:complete len:96 (+) Transcript_11962:60-347(+)